MAARVFAAMSRARISVVLITQSSSEYSISFCVPQSDCVRAERAMQEEFYLELKEGLLEPLAVTERLAIISVVGDGMRTLRGISAKFFAALARANINIVAIAQGSSERSISVVVNNDDATTGVRVTHQMLFNTDQVIEVFVIGVGGVGGALLEQLKRQQSWLKNKHIDLRVCGVANSKALLTNVHGLNLENWQEELAQAKEPFNLGRLIRLVKEYHLLNRSLLTAPPARQWRINMPTSCAKVSTLSRRTKRPTPRRWITTICCVMRRKNRGVNSSMTPTLGLDYRLLRTCKICSMLVMN